MQNLIEIGQLGTKVKTCKVMKNVKLKNKQTNKQDLSEGFHHRVAW